MSIAPWRSPLARALHRNRALPHARYFQLATVRPNGRPANRTVVFRGFLDDTNQLKIVTDARSEKVNHIDDTPWGEGCWYFPTTREQFRLAGQLIVVREDCVDEKLQKARGRSWQELSDSARAQFTWPHPGTPRDQAGFNTTPHPDPVTPPPNFCLLLLNPFQVDHLELRGDPQNRFTYDFNEFGGWSMQSINP